MSSTKTRTVVAVVLIGLSGEPAAAQVSRAERAIYGGNEVSACDWPAVVAVGECSGVLVHPEVVLLAAHCVRDAPTEVEFGNQRATPDRTVAITVCQAHPEFESEPDGNDIAYCLLAQPVIDRPYVPLLTTENESRLAAGQLAEVVGFGVAEDGGPGGIKRAVSLPILEIGLGEATLGGDGKDSCVGDSGGPGMLRLADDSWRVFGLVSTGLGTCGTGGDYTLTLPHLSWLTSATERQIATIANEAQCSCAPRDDTAAQCCGQLICNQQPMAGDAGCQNVNGVGCGWLLLLLGCYWRRFRNS